MRRGFGRNLTESSRKAAIRAKSACLPHAEVCEPRLGFAPKLHRLAAPSEAHGTRVQSVIRQNQLRSLLIRQTAFDQCQIECLIPAVNLVAHDGMTQVREMEADLMLAPGTREEPEQGERDCAASKMLFQPELRLRRRPIRAHAILDGHRTTLVFAQ